MTRARAGEAEAFSELLEPYGRELQVHCYRILGSAQDAEDALQETLLAAWRGFGGFDGRASIRTWLYRVATSRCLNALRSASRRPSMNWDPELAVPEPSRMGDVAWLEPYPDVLLEGLADTAPGPEARYELKEAISLAFVAALQLLPPRQHVALILRDVLGFRAAEVAHMLDTTQESVTSALKFLFVYRVPQDYTPGDPKVGAAWEAWFASVGANLVDPGSRVLESSSIGTLGAGSRIGEYSVVTADDLEAALAVATGCPAIGVGGGVEVGLTVEIPPSAATRT